MSHGPAWTRALAASRLKASGGSRGRDGDSMVQYGKPNEMIWNTGVLLISLFIVTPRSILSRGLRCFQVECGYCGCCGGG